MQKLNLFAFLIIIVAAGLLTRELFPKRVQTNTQVPVIVTEYDTVVVYRPPDTIKVATTDTINLVLTETLVDTTVIQIPCEPEERDNINPVLHLRMGKQFGDTSLVETFNLRTGTVTQSRIYTPGYLTGLDITSNPVPRLDFTAFPRCNCSLFTKLTSGLVGFGACEVTHLFRN